MKMKIIRMIKNSTLVVFAIFTFNLIVAPQNSGKPRFLSIIQENHPQFDCRLDDELEKRIFNGYGAVFISEGAIFPDTCMFKSEDAVLSFQSTIKAMKGSKLQDIEYHLQPLAAAKLELVFKELGGYLKLARNYNKSTATHPNGLNDDWAMRTLKQTQCNWTNSGSDLARCEENIKADFVTRKEIVKKLSNQRHMFSYAIPGGSQHHFGLAIDINNNKKGIPDSPPGYEKSLNKYGWYRTIPFDTHHFTFLGYTKAEELTKHGLKRITCEKLQYWVPDLPKEYANPYIERHCTASSSEK